MRGFRSRRAWTVAAVAAAAVLVIAGLSLYASDEDPEASGGAIIGSAPASMTIRCLGPEVVVDLNGFEGAVTFTNCFPNSTVVGNVGDPVVAGSNLTCAVDGSSDELRLSAAAKESFRFAVMGDSQGQNDILAEALEETVGCEFIIHLGDMTPSGQPSEYDAFEDTLRPVAIPVLTTPGNHDVKLGGDLEYASRFGDNASSFVYSGVTFAFVDSSDGVISEDEVDWLTGAFADADRKVLVTHMPSYDPFGNDHTLEPDSCDRIQNFVIQKDVDVVLTGHIHAYHLMNVEGTDLLISGGAGGDLVDGVHHIVIVTVDETGFSYEKVELGYVAPAGPHVEIIGKDGSRLNLTYEEIMQMDLTRGDSSYENLYGNIEGDGSYTGVLVRSLIELVGGLDEGDLLRIVSQDGYSQDFGYLNAYPDATWLALQGEMVIALEFDGIDAPDWTEGPRLAMLPSDGLYSNSDCEQTSYEGQGYYVYESAGARWVKHVLTITVEAIS